MNLYDSVFRDFIKSSCYNNFYKSFLIASEYFNKET